MRDERYYSFIFFGRLDCCYMAEVLMTWLPPVRDGLAGCYCTWKECTLAVALGFGRIGVGFETSLRRMFD